TGASNARCDPSGSRTEIIEISKRKKSAGEPHFFQGALVQEDQPSVKRVRSISPRSSNIWRIW
ncbi:MAG TPA: hypothetical protein PLR35_14930, partial [Burkholderiaceae bacterium]|nr:hypothetical protein [Burkholderiaceae bacterium]